MIDQARSQSFETEALDGQSAPVRREEICTQAMARRVAAMLDLRTDDLRLEAPLPRGWQFMLLAADTPRSALRADGFPGLGVPMPDLGLPRLMLGGRQVSISTEIPIGATVERESQVRSVSRKTTAAGPMAVVTLAHTLSTGGQVALVETQTYLLLPARSESAASPGAASAASPAPVPEAPRRKTVIPDDTLLFQYSALGFNSHRIHLDRRYACEVEGFPDLVVNGGLATLLLTEFLRMDLGLVAKDYVVRHVAPLYCNRPITLTAEPSGAGWNLKAFDDQSRLAVDMRVIVQ